MADNGMQRAISVCRNFNRLRKFDQGRAPLGRGAMGGAVHCNDPESFGHQRQGDFPQLTSTTLPTVNQQHCRAVVAPDRSGQRFAVE